MYPVLFRNRLMAAAGTLLIAFVAGQFVQSSDKIVETARQPAVATPFDVREVTPLSTNNNDLHLVQSEALVLPVLPVAPPAAQNLPALPSQDNTLEQKLTALDEAQQKPEPEGRALNAFGLPCETALRARPMPGAMVELSMQATCHAGQIVEISQDRLRFTQIMPESGELTVMVPALVPLTVFLAELPDGTVLTAPVQVEEAAQFERVALQWIGDTGYHLHAFEFGASYGDTGHIWADNTRNAPADGENVDGFLTLLGTKTALGGWQAEVYSFPRDTDELNGVVRLNIEAEVTKANCARQILAETLQADPDGQMQSAELSMKVPDCDAVGEFLVLKNILQDLKIAQN